MSDVTHQPRSPRFARAPSVFSTTSNDTLVADQPYRGYSSQEAYLEALREWVDSKKYDENNIQLQGFYGTKTSEYYKNKPGLRSGRKERRATAPELNTVTEEGEGAPKESKPSRWKKIFSRRTES